HFAPFVHDLRVSTYFETAPVDVVGDQWDFLNAAATGGTDLQPRDLLEKLLAIEAARGRERPHPSAPRTLDLDIVLFGSDRIDEPRTVVAHPRFPEARLVLDPLAEIAPDWRDPVTGKTVAELRALLLTAP